MSFLNVPSFPVQTSRADIDTDSTISVSYTHLRQKLVRFGYAQLTARADSLLLRAGETVPVHEFHYCCLLYTSRCV